MTPDIQVENGGTLFLFRPLTDKAKQWLDENVQAESWQWYGPALVVDHRYAVELALGAQKDGLKLI